MISIIKDYLHHQPTTAEIDEHLLQLAKAHEVEAIIYKQTHDSRLRSKYAYTIYSYQNRMKLAEEISALLKQAGIPFFFVKGLEVAKYYPDPCLKTMGDSDLIVHLEDKEKTADLLMSNGFFEAKDDRDRRSEWHFYKNGLEIELHHALLYGRDAFEIVNDNFLKYVSECWKYVTDDKLNDSYHLIYLLLHLRKHLINQGIGIRQFLDIACFSKAEIDWDFVNKELSELRLLKFANTVYGLIYKWWNLKFPLTAEISNEFCTRATKEILESGVFGTEKDADAKFEKSIINEVHAGRSIWRQKLAFIFPSYYYMCKTGYCAGLIGRPYLLPFYWIKRAFHYRSEVKEKFHRYKISNEDLNNGAERFVDWGL